MSLWPASAAAPPQPEPIGIDQLGFLLFPAHFSLALLLLQPYFHVISQIDGYWWGRANPYIRGQWAACAAMTALFAVRPFWVATRRRRRRGLWGVVLNMVGCGYLNLLLCVLIRRASCAGSILDLASAATVIAVPFVLASTVPFAVLGLPLLSKAWELEREWTFDDRDALVRLVGVHALVVVALVAAGLPLDWNAARTPTGLASMGVTATYGLALLVGGTVGIRARQQFIRRVLLEGVPEYVVTARSGSPLPLNLARWSSTHDTGRVLFYQPVVPGEGAYRSGISRIPVARL